MLPKWTVGDTYGQPCCAHVWTGFLLKKCCANGQWATLMDSLAVHMYGQGFCYHAPVHQTFSAKIEPNQTFLESHLVGGCPFLTSVHMDLTFKFKRFLPPCMFNLKPQPTNSLICILYI